MADSSSARVEPGGPPFIDEDSKPKHRALPKSEATSPEAQAFFAQADQRLADLDAVRSYPSWEMQ